MNQSNYKLISMRTIKELLFYTAVPKSLKDLINFNTNELYTNEIDSLIFKQAVIAGRYIGLSFQDFENHYGDSNIKSYDTPLINSLIRSYVESGDCTNNLYVKILHRGYFKDLIDQIKNNCDLNAIKLDEDDLSEKQILFDWLTHKSFPYD